MKNESHIVCRPKGQKLDPEREKREALWANDMRGMFKERPSVKAAEATDEK